MSGSFPEVRHVEHTWERAAFSAASWSTSKNCFSNSASSLSLLTFSCATCSFSALSYPEAHALGEVTGSHVEYDTV